VITSCFKALRSSAHHQARPLLPAPFTVWKPSGVQFASEPTTLIIYLSPSSQVQAVLDSTSCQAPPTTKPIGHLRFHVHPNVDETLYERKTSASSRVFAHSWPDQSCTCGDSSDLCTFKSWKWEWPQREMLAQLKAAQQRALANEPVNSQNLVSVPRRGQHRL